MVAKMIVIADIPMFTANAVVYCGAAEPVFVVSSGCRDQTVRTATL